MKKLLLFLTLIVGFVSTQAQNNPFAEYGYTPKVATLSQGQFNESFDNDTIVQIGSVLFNTKSKQIVAFVEYDTLYSEATLEPDIVSRWMSPDPLADHPNQIGLSPYQYGWNNPIYWTDPDGRCPLCPWIDAVVDVGFVLYDVGKLGYDYATTGETKGEDWAALAADGASILVPMSVGAGVAARAAYKGVDKVMDASKVVDKANDANKAVNSNADTYYRYVGEGEAKAIIKTGEIPNVDAKGNPKDIYMTDRNYKTAGKAKTHNQLPNKPSYKVEIDPKNVNGQTPFKRVDPADNPQWGVGGGRESTTPNPIKVDPKKITPLK